MKQFLYFNSSDDELTNLQRWLLSCRQDEKEYVKRTRDNFFFYDSLSQLQCNPLAPKSDQHTISPQIITPELDIEEKE